MKIVLEHEARERIERLAGEHEVSLSELSRVLKRGDGYMARYLRDQVPYVLGVADKRRLASLFGKPEGYLG